MLTTTLTMADGSKIVTKDALLSPKDWDDAIEIQDACNLSGVVFSFARVMQRICNSTAGDTSVRNHHAIARLYADKIMQLTGGRAFSEAFDECWREAGRPE